MVCLLVAPAECVVSHILRQLGRASGSSFYSSHTGKLVSVASAEYSEKYHRVPSLSSRPRSIAMMRRVSPTHFSIAVLSIEIRVVASGAMCKELLFV
jgi:hypothetical protein